MRAAGICIDEIHPSDASSQDTGKCLVLVTEDAQRTMCTNLGISSELSIKDLNLNELKKANFLYVEGYLAASESGSQVAIEAIRFAKENGIRVALTLSDVSMINLFKSNLENFCENEIDTIFCNEEEALCWAGTDRVGLAFKQLKEIGREIHITIGSEGSVVSDSNGNAKEIKGFEAKAIDTIGAGDMYAAAALSLIAKGSTHFEAAHFANYAAAKIVCQYGARLASKEAYIKLYKEFLSAKGS
jgi:sugar/nucleoside kinase (ribokinase family)